MVDRTHFGDYISGLLPGMEDYAPNGLQVEGNDTIEHLITGVTACEAFIVQAIDKGADAILVHHGLFWRGDDPCVVDMKAGRLRPLMAANCNLYAYHLPLDVHPVYGNNAQLAAHLGWAVAGTFDCLGVKALGMHALLQEPLSPGLLKKRIAERLNQEPLHLPGGPSAIRSVAWCTGGAQDAILDAYKLGADAFITGEVSERTTHQARELGIHFYAAGHHATERYGVQALGQHLAHQFNMKHSFIDVPNPI